MSYSRRCSSCGETWPLGRFPKAGKDRSDVCADCRTLARRRARTPAVRKAAREARLRREYGISLDDYDRMGRAQHWRCAICHLLPYPKGSRLVVDHDHATGAVRALLCSSCNSALGLLGEWPDRLHEAVRYLSHHADLRSQLTP